MNSEEMFSIVCPSCGREAGKPCGHWEGAPVACMQRADAVKALMRKRTDNSTAGPDEGL